jgi:hypothetical protein
MQYKPWIIIIIGLCHIIEPVAKILYYSLVLSKNPILLVEQQFYSLRFFHIFNFFLSFPIAGIAILSVKKWSLPVFLTVQILVIGDFLFKVPTFYENDQFGIIISSVIFMLINIILVMYFLGSTLRIAYLDPKIRWWETCPRYLVKISAQSQFGAIEIVDLSLSGAYVTVKEKPSDNFELNFTLYEESFQLICQPVHEIKLYENPGCGVLFIRHDKSTTQRLKQVMKKVKKAGYSCRPEKISFFKGLYNWLFNKSLSEKIFPLTLKNGPGEEKKSSKK